MDFSIIIPAKNEAHNIGLCLSSIKKNDFPNDRYEIIVVDNGSDDDTIKIAEHAGAKVYCKPGITISALRNFGSSVAQGRILVFLDADCSVKDDWLVNATRYIDINDVVCFGSAPVIPDDSTWVQKTWFMVRQRENKSIDVPWLESMNMFVVKEAYQAVKGFDEALVTCEDVDISYRLSKHGRIVSDPSIVAVHHGEAATVKQFFNKEKWRGKSNYKGLVRHGIKLDELPSLIIPLYYGLFMILFVFALLFFRISYAVLLFFILEIPVFLMVFVKIHRKKYDYLQILKLIFLYNIYYCARFFSVF